MSRDETGSESRDLALIEAALFLSPQPMTRRGLASILGGVQLSYVDQLLDELAEALEQSARAIELHVEDGRAMLRVRKEFVEAVAHLAPQQDIPRPVLRTLAVIAYNHPITQANLVRVRGNKAYGHVQELLERRLIRAEEQGRTYLLHTTKEFLRHFGLKTIEEFRFHVAGSLEELDIDSLPDADDRSTDAEETEAIPTTPRGEGDAEDEVPSAQEPDDLPDAPSPRDPDEEEAGDNEDADANGDESAAAGEEPDDELSDEGDSNDEDASHPDEERDDDEDPERPMMEEVGNG